MRVAICDDNQQDIERIRRYTLRMIDYAVEYVFYTRPEELLRECADAEQKPDMYILQSIAGVSYQLYQIHAKCI